MDRSKDRRENSRSPVRSEAGLGPGRRDSHPKNDSAFDNILTVAPKPDIRVKDEPKKDDEPLLLVSGGMGGRVAVPPTGSDPLRDRLPPTVDQTAGSAAMMGTSFLTRGLTPHGMAMLDRTRMMAPFGLAHTVAPGMERHPHHLAMWADPFRDAYRSLDFHAHRMEFQREVEREREMIHRLNSMNPMMYQRDREPLQHDFSRHLEASALDRFQHLDRERQAALDRAKLNASLRPAEQAYLQSVGPGMFPSPLNPLVNSAVRSKSNSPMGGAMGVPPPLIPSASANNQNHAGQRSQGNSPAIHKLSTASPVVENSHDGSHGKSGTKKDPGSNAPELESQSR